MLAYNVRTYNYLDGQQIRVYKNMIVKHPEDWVTPIKKQEEKKTTKTQGVKDEERSNKNSQNRTIQKIYEITRSNMWEYFITLTFDPKKVDSFNYEEVSKKLSKWLNHLKDMRLILDTLSYRNFTSPAGITFMECLQIAVTWNLLIPEK